MSQRERRSLFLLLILQLTAQFNVRTSDPDPDSDPMPLASQMGMWSSPSRRSDGPLESVEALARSAPLASSNISDGGEQVAVAGVPVSMNDTGAFAGRAQENENRAGPGTAAVKLTSPGSRSVGVGANKVDTLLLVSVFFFQAASRQIRTKSSCKGSSGSIVACMAEKEKSRFYLLVCVCVSLRHF